MSRNSSCSLVCYKFRYACILERSLILNYWSMSFAPLMLHNDNKNQLLKHKIVRKNHILLETLQIYVLGLFKI